MVLRAAICANEAAASELCAHCAVSNISAVSFGSIERRPHVQRNPYTGGVRVSFEFDPAAAGRSDLRLDLDSPDGVSSESWRYRWIR